MEIDTSISNFINIFNIGKRKIFIAGKEKIFYIRLLKVFAVYLQLQCRIQRQLLNKSTKVKKKSPLCILHYSFKILTMYDKS